MSLVIEFVLGASTSTGPLFRGPAVVIPRLPQLSKYPQEDRKFAQEQIRMWARAGLALKIGLLCLCVTVSVCLCVCVSVYLCVCVSLRLSN